MWSYLCQIKTIIGLLLLSATNREACLSMNFVSSEACGTTELLRHYVLAIDEMYIPRERLRKDYPMRVKIYRSY